MSLRLRQLNDLWGNPRHQAGIDLSFPLGPICTDTRKLEKGCFFVPLIGKNFDGHKFLKRACDYGAQATVVSFNSKVIVPENFLHWLVDDTLHAYQQLALLHRCDFDIPVIAVTGSVGKTTTRDLIKAVLNPLGNILATSGNENNDVGVPLTLLEANQNHSAIVIEMGMRGLGEIQRLSACSKPDVAVITNIGSAHIGRLGSRRNIAIAKCEITSHLNPHGVVIIPANDPLLDDVLSKCWKGKVVRVAIEDSDSSHGSVQVNSYTYNSPDIDLLGRAYMEKGLLEVEERFFKLPLEGKHNMKNFLLALAVAKEIGVQLDEVKDLRLEKLSGRNNVINLDKITILDETYNSSPESVKASMELLVSQSGRHFAVLGEMFELGEYSLSLHRQVAEWALNLSLDGLVIVSQGVEGQVMAEVAAALPFVEIVLTPEDAFKSLCKLLQPGDVVLLKASRAVSLERLIPLLERHF